MNWTSGLAPARSWSLRRRMLTLAAIASLIAWASGSFAVLRAADDNSHRLFDERLRDVARMVLQFSSHEIMEVRASGGGTVHEETALTLGSHYQYQIWSRRGELLLRSFNAPETPIAPLDRSGFDSSMQGGKPVRTFTAVAADGQMIIEVSEFSAYREHFHTAASGYFLPFMVTSLIALIGLNWWLIQRALRPIEASAAQLIKRSPDDLAPVVVDGPPIELSPLIESINMLFERFGRTLSAERGFTAAAAHELRTPLAAIRAQAQVALRSKTPEESSSALRALMGGVDRAARSIDQLLTLARLDDATHERSETRKAFIDTIVTEVVNDLRPLLEQRTVALRMSLNEAELDCHPFAVETLVRNLIDNATRYCGAGGRVHVTVESEASSVIFTVDDSGPGIPENERAKVFERFYRLNETVATGSGLGLSIVRAVADLHDATIELLDSPLGGLRVRVVFPVQTVSET